MLGKYMRASACLRLRYRRLHDFQHQVDKIEQAALNYDAVYRLPE
jgi:hypothetical protein